jgi:N6-adenosine-specific RNA methylase IME4
MSTLVAQGEREILAAAKAIKAEKAAARRRKRVEKLVEISRGNAPLVSSAGSSAPVLFPVIYADPPWRYDQHQDSNRGVNNHYPTMDLDAIKALSVSAKTTPDAVLFLWAVSPLLPEALEVIRAWGFTYKTSWVWDKERPGMGFWGRVQHEFVLVATRGNPPTPPPAARPPSVFRIPRGEHSAKPEEVRCAIEAMFPELPKLELFARFAAQGWAVWGNQAPQP